MPQFQFVLPLPFLCLCVDLAAETRLYLGSSVFASIIEVDTATGNRKLIDLDDWPRVIKATDLAVSREGFVYFDAFDALQRTGIHRVDPTSQAVLPISGGIDGFRNDLLGEGPSFGRIDHLSLDGGQLFAISLGQTLIRTELTTGDRFFVTSPPEPPTSRTLALDQPSPGALPNNFVDLVPIDAQTLLVADAFEGLMYVDIPSGRVTSWNPGSILRSNPRRLDLAPDGRLLYSIADPDEAALWAVNLRTGTETLFSGSFGGIEAGDGPLFRSPSDIAVDARGNIWVYDALELSLYRLTQDGDRTLVSSPTVGSGDDFFSFQFSPSLATFEKAYPSQRLGWLVY
ncbi:MAG: hypothetical protein RLY93_11090 [Sumerlaeia bacterium]